MNRLLLTLFLMLTAAFGLEAQNSCFPLSGDIPFKAGEKIKMGMYYKWGAVNTEVATGELSLTESALNGKSVYKTTLTAETAPFFSVFYDMHEHFDTWFEKDAVKPLKYYRNTKQGDYRAFNNYIYDWSRRVIHADINYGGRGQQVLDIPIHDCVCDITSILYLIRTMDFEAVKEGQKIPISFAIDDTVFDILLTYRGRETVKVKRMGKVRCQKFACSVVSGALFDGKTDMLIWFSDDSNHLPVGFMAPLKIGSAQGWLKQAQDLKYPFDAREK